MSVSREAEALLLTITTWWQSCFLRLLLLRVASEVCWWGLRPSIWECQYQFTIELTVDRMISPLGIQTRLFWGNSGGCHRSLHRSGWQLNCYGYLMWSWGRGRGGGKRKGEGERGSKENILRYILIFHCILYNVRGALYMRLETVTLSLRSISFSPALW